MWTTVDFTTLLYLILFSIIFYLVINQIKFIRAVNRIPGVWGPLNIQFFGVALEFLGKTEAERLKLLQNYAERYTGVGKVKVGSATDYWNAFFYRKFLNKLIKNWDYLILIKKLENIGLRSSIDC